MFTQDQMIVREGATALEGLIELTRNNDGWSLDKTLVCICESVVCVLVIRIQCQLFSAVIHMLWRATVYVLRTTQLC